MSESGDGTGFRFLVIGLAAVALLVIIIHYNGKVCESKTTPPRAEGFRPAPARPQRKEPFTADSGNMFRTSPELDAAFAPPSAPPPHNNAPPAGAADLLSGGRDTLTPQDLLPSAGNTDEEKHFATMNPGGQGEIAGMNFLSAGGLIGQMTTMPRNPNYQLRSDPPIPKEAVSPWMMSTLSPDNNRKTFEIE